MARKSEGIGQKKKRNKKIRGKEFRARQVNRSDQRVEGQERGRESERKIDREKGLPYARIMFHPHTTRPTGNNRKFVGIIAVVGRIAVHI